MAGLDPAISQPLHRRPDQMMCDRRWPRHFEPVRMRIGDHVLKLSLAEPARILELGRIDADRAALHTPDEPDHQARGKGPRLARMIGNVIDEDARLLENLPPCRLLDRLARLHEAGRSEEHTS